MHFTFPVTNTAPTTALPHSPPLSSSMETEIYKATNILRSYTKTGGDRLAWCQDAGVCLPGQQFTCRLAWPSNTTLGGQASHTPRPLSAPRSGLAASRAHHPARHPARRGGAGGAVCGARGRGVEPQRGQRAGGGAHRRGRLVSALRPAQPGQQHWLADWPGGSGPGEGGRGSGYTVELADCSSRHCS